MDKFVINTNISLVQQSNEDATKAKSDSQKFEPSTLIVDPGLRIPISEYHPRIRDQVRRAYLQKGPCQPNNYIFKMRKIGNSLRRFNPAWFAEHKTWLEYSVAKEAAFCLCCYLFKTDVGRQGGGDAFVKEGFDAWNKNDRFDKHKGRPNSAHDQTRRKCEDLMRQEQHIDVTLNRHSDQIKKEYRIRLGASIDCIQFLLKQGLALRGHDESDESTNQGNFLDNNLKVTSLDIQHDIINASALETVNSIIGDLRDNLFSILIDESRDISIKEQMIIVLRYVEQKGRVLEKFIGIVHVPNTSASSLKCSIDSLFSKHKLSISRIRGQGYDGASNMRGEFNGLKSLILRENESAHYIHYFAHQLQLTLVAIAKNDIHVGSLFNMLAILVNVVGASCKRQDMLRE
ncbi:uncharacterized protein LOC141664872 [Apium graveolens]|uniref:uncharacterized protein LOC141664872 n=1 Tax=Apium graveolens TaxID=4045 RepID=UPI003D7AF8EB